MRLVEVSVGDGTAGDYAIRLHIDNACAVLLPHEAIEIARALEMAARVIENTRGEAK